MPIAVPSTPQTAHPSNRLSPSTLSESASFRDSKGFAVRLGIRASGIRSLGFSARDTTRSQASLSLHPASAQKSFFSRMPNEPEDARLTGITRSLARRLLALNLRGSLRARPVMRVEVPFLSDKFA